MNSIHFFVEGSLRKYRPLFESVCPAPMMVPKGQNLCTQCYTHGWLYYILDGLAKVYISTSDGNEQIIDFMKQDTLIGMDCIDDENKSVVSITSVVDSDHILNILLELKGKLPEDKDKMLGLIDYFLELPQEQQDIFRLGRRLGLMGELRDLHNSVLVDKVKRTMEQSQVDRSNLDAVCDRLMIRAIPI